MDLLKEPQALILLVFMIIAGLKWVLDNIRGIQPGQDEEEQTFTDLYEEARRQIQERQGRMSPDQEEARERLEEYAEPRIFEPVAPPPPPLVTPPPIPSQAGASTRQRPAKPKRPTLSAAEQAALERVKQAGTLGAGARHKIRRTPIRDLLATPSAARDAIVLREILGPPKGHS